MADRTHFRGYQTLHKWSSAIASVVFLLFSSYSLMGCLVVPAGGPPLGLRGPLPGKPDLKFIQPSKTERAEINDKLRAIDSGCGNEQFFWGRWSKPSGEVIPLHGHHYSSSSSEITYEVHNLLVDFDSHGIVQGSRLVTDEKLIPELRALQAKIQSPDLSVPRSFAIDFVPWKGGLFRPLTKPGTIVLSSDSIQLIDSEKGEHSFTAPRSSLLRVYHDRKSVVTTFANEHTIFNQDPAIIAVVLDLKVSGSERRALRTNMGLCDLMTVLQFQRPE